MRSGLFVCSKLFNCTYSSVGAKCTQLHTPLTHSSRYNNCLAYIQSAHKEYQVDAHTSARDFADRQLPLVDKVVMDRYVNDIFQSYVSLLVMVHRRYDIQKRIAQGRKEIRNVRHYCVLLETRIMILQQIYGSLVHEIAQAYSRTGLQRLRHVFHTRRLMRMKTKIESKIVALHQEQQHRASILTQRTNNLARTIVEVHKLESIISQCYDESIHLFKATNIMHRRDGVVPLCFTHDPLPLPRLFPHASMHHS